MSERDMTIVEFCDVHCACPWGRAWAVNNCQTLWDVWAQAKPKWLIWVATRKGVLDDKTLRLFSCWSVRQVWHLLAEPQLRQFMEVAERFAVGNASHNELAVAWSAARGIPALATWDLAKSVAWSAVRATARAVALDTAAQSAEDSVADAAMRSAEAAAWYAASSVVPEPAGSVVVDDSWYASWYAARGASWYASWYAAQDAAVMAQATWLRENAKPCFVRVPVVAGEAITSEAI